MESMYVGIGFLGIADEPVLIANDSLAVIINSRCDVMPEYHSCSAIRTCAHTRSIKQSLSFSISEEVRNASIELITKKKYLTIEIYL